MYKHWNYLSDKVPVLGRICLVVLRDGTAFEGYIAESIGGEKYWYRTYLYGKDGIDVGGQSLHENDIWRYSTPIHSDELR